MKSVTITFRDAVLADLDAIIALLANDALGALREHYENPLPDAYTDAFAEIQRDPNNTIIVAVQSGAVVGVLQLTIIPNLTYVGRRRALIEGVRVAESVRGQGLGRSLIQHAIDRARKARCHMVQLTTSKQRPSAIQFYESLGFKASHEGMKLGLPE